MFLAQVFGIPPFSRTSAFRMYYYFFKDIVLMKQNPKTHKNIAYENIFI